MTNGTAHPVHISEVANLPGLMDGLQEVAWTQIVPFVIGVAGLFVNFVSGSLSWGTRRRIDEMSKMHGQLPEACRGEIEGVINEEVARYVQSVKRRASRHIDVDRVAIVLLIFSAGVFVFWGLLWTVVEWGWLMWIPTILFVIVFLMIMSAGSMSAIYYGNERPKLQRKKRQAAASEG